MSFYEAIYGDEHYGITNVRLSNFKSIKQTEEPQEIKLAPLTLLCGENSSGKSSLLHSILLLTQAISSNKESNDTFPLNGNLIKLNEFKNILHHNDLQNNSEYGEYIDNLYKSFMNIGIDIVSIYGSDNLINTQIKLDTNLTADIDISSSNQGMEFNGIRPFPLNEKTSVEFQSTSTANAKFKSEIYFSKLPIDQNVIVFDAINNGVVKQFPNYMWNCKYQSNATDINSETKSKDDTFKGVEFNSGIPSKVSKRKNLIDYLAGKTTDQVREIFQNSEFVRDILFDWLNNSFINDGLDSIDRDVIKENEEISVDIISQFVEQFDIMYETDLKDFNFNIPPGSFTLRRNIEPWASAEYRNYYKNSKQLGTDLVKSSSKSGLSEHSELFELILYRIGLEIATNLIIERQANDSGLSSNDDIDNEEIAEDLKQEVFLLFEAIIDTNFYVELKSRLYSKFEYMYKNEDDLYYVNELAGTESEQEINSTLDYLREVTKLIKYIGPLRMLENDEPRVESFETNIPMGLKGEYFFNYYESKKDNKLQESDKYFLDLSGNQEIQDQEEITVAEKFNEVLNFFEIAESFFTEYNHENDSIVGYIKPIGLDKNIKMTELGVGFSQLAPIILLCITASPGTTILLEQPELHLHPKVQQKFADFIIEMTEKNKLQIILETHSDHTLNRIRRRIAQAKLEKNDSSLFKNCSILFAERENGITEFRKANLTNSGTYDLTDFPKGFFDQGAEDAFFILKASMEEDNA